MAIANGPSPQTRAQAPTQPNRPRGENQPLMTVRISLHGPRPLPPAPSPAERAGATGRGFAAVLRANELCESGGRFVASQRPTTAAAPAGYGRAQLNTRNHVELLGRLGDARLAALGIDRKDLAALSARGAAAQDWYAAIVGGRTREGSVVPAADARAIAEITAKGPVAEADVDALVARVGAAFRSTTGLEPSELRFMVSTRLLASAPLAREYREARRGGVGRAAALDGMGDRVHGLTALRERVGDAWIERTWTDHRLNENRAAWFTRAAMTEDASFGRLMDALQAGGDVWTSRHLALDHVRRAVAVASGLRGFLELHEDEQVRLVGQLVRLRGLAPVLFEAVTQGVLDVPSLEARLAALRDDPASSGGAALRAFLRHLRIGPSNDFVMV